MHSKVLSKTIDGKWEPMRHSKPNIVTGISRGNIIISDISIIVVFTIIIIIFLTTSSHKAPTPEISLQLIDPHLSYPRP